MSVWDLCLNLLFPPKCPFCGRVLDRPGICQACEKALPWTVGEETVRILSDGVRCVAPLWYEGLAREGLLRLKFQGRASAAEPLGALVAQCAAEYVSGEFDVVTWVPVSRRRLRKRGYDQAELLARAACRLWQTKPQRLLYKDVHNLTQSTLTEPAARRANVLGVYRGAEAARGHRILLIDDICTTGATLTECVRVLRQMGAIDVVCAAVALSGSEKRHKKADFVKE